MKITLGKILNSTEGLKKLVDEQMPVKTGYKLKRIIDAVTSETSRIEKTRVELIQKYADPQTDEEKKKKEPIKVTTMTEAFRAEFIALLEEEVDLNCVQLPFKDIEHISMSISQLTSLEPWFGDIPAEFTDEVIKSEDVESGTDVAE